MTDFRWSRSRTHSRKQRWIALPHYQSNIGFLMYTADTFGYLGSVIVLLIKNFAHLSMSWLALFTKIAYVTAVIMMALGTANTLYFINKEKYRNAMGKCRVLTTETIMIIF